MQYECPFFFLRNWSNSGQASMSQTSKFCDDYQILPDGMSRKLKNMLKIVCATTGRIALLARMKCELRIVLPRCL